MCKNRGIYGFLCPSSVLITTDYYAPPVIVLYSVRVLYYCAVPRPGLVLNRKPKAVFFGRFFSVFLDRKPTFWSRFFGCPKKPKPKNRLVFFRSFFFSAVPYANNALHICIEAPSYRYSPLAPGARRYQHAEEQHGGTGITFFYIVLPGTGIDIIMASYPPRGLYNSTLHHPILFTQDLV